MKMREEKKEKCKDEGRSLAVATLVGDFLDSCWCW
jgi:hypothetical protein